MSVARIAFGVFVGTALLVAIVLSGPWGLLLFFCAGLALLRWGGFNE